MAKAVSAAAPPPAATGWGYYYGAPPNGYYYAPPSAYRAPPADTASCPKCKGSDLERLLSHVSMSSENTRQLNFNKARQAAKRVQRDKDVAQAEYEKKHREEGH